MKKFISLFLVFSILLLSGNLYAKKKGAKLAIQKTDGQKIKGELIAVKKDSLLLLEQESGADVSVDIRNIEMVKIKKSKTLLGASLGFLAGVGVGALGTTVGWEIWSWAPKDTKTKYRIMAWVGTFSGLLGAWIGAVIGGASKTIQFDEKSGSEIQEILEQLRKKARVPDYQ